ncbi:MAG: amino-acid N-acetyltransferase [Verrucomicrobiota bacterium]
MNVSDLREILQYVPRFRERTFVVAVDGEVVASENFSNVLLDIAVLRSLSIKVVLVHGASYQIQRLAAERKVAISNSDGIGLTDPATLQLSIDAAIRLTNEIMEGLSSVDLRAAYINALIAHPAGILGGVDQQYTGKVERVDVKALKLLLDEGIIPVVPPLGFDGEGRTYRVNSDSIALEIAEELSATKILYLTPSSAFAAPADLPRQLSVSETQEVLKKRKAEFPPGLVSKLEYAAKACVQGVPRVHVLDGAVNEALLNEVFSHDGIGTMIYSNEYQQIRRIFKKDVRAVMSLIRQSVHNEELVRRTRAEILDHLEDYWLLEIDRSPIACVALHLYPEESSGELACLHVSKAHENQGHGKKLMAFVENLAREKGVKNLFALSTQAYSYLQQKGGYESAEPSLLPAERRAKYEASGRNSKVLLKVLRS